MDLTRFLANYLCYWTSIHLYFKRIYNIFEVLIQYCMCVFNLHDINNIYFNYKYNNRYMCTV